MNRIDFISSLTNGYKSIADVGCDHAFISINAVTKYNVLKSYAMDINDGPLENARVNIKSKSLEDKIKTIKSDGLISLNDTVEAVVIAGMGGLLISKILNDSLDKAKSCKALILSPNSEEAELRGFLVNNSFEIINEYIINDSKHYYEIIVAIPSVYKSLSDMDVKFGPILRCEKPAEFINKYEKKLSIYEDSYNKCSSEKKEALKKSIDEIREVLYGDN